MSLVLTTREELRELFFEALEKHQANTTPPPQPEPTAHLHSIKELADFLDCSIVTAHKLKKSGKIRYKQFGRKLIFSTSEVLEDLAKIKNR